MKAIIPIKGKVIKRGNIYQFKINDTDVIEMFKLSSKRVTIKFPYNGTYIPISNIKISYDKSYKKYITNLPSKLNKIFEQVWQKDQDIRIIIELNGD